jgi:hypothetical protein
MQKTVRVELVETGTSDRSPFDTLKANGRYRNALRSFTSDIIPAWPML